MRIWVDADACPKVIKEILFRAAVRSNTFLVLVSNHPITTPPSPLISKIQVEAGFDVSDNKILKKISPDDLVITADIPLASSVINQGAIALNPRGELYSKINIKEHLALRNLSTDLRGSGLRTGGPKTLTKQEVQRFGNALDGLLAKNSTPK